MNEELYRRDLRHWIAVRAAYEGYQRASARMYAYITMNDLSHWRTKALEHREMIETLHWVRTGNWGK